MNDLCSPGSDCWACSGISRPRGAQFAVAEILRCCWQEEEGGGDPGAPALDEAGSGCKAHCCCWLQEGLLVIGRVGVDLCPPGSGEMLYKR